MAMKWQCWFCRRAVPQEDTVRISCPYCGKTGSDGWAIEAIVSKKTLARLKKHRMDPIDDLKVPDVVKAALKEIKTSVEGAWKDVVKDLKFRAKVDTQKIKLLQQELKLAEKEILCLQRALDSRPMSTESTYIARVFDVTTGNMTKADAEALEHDANEGSAPVYKLGDYGFLVYAGDPEANWPKGRMSEAFLKVIAQAAKLECSYVRFDCDGEPYPGLEVFEW